jgi:subtilisin family serine protease
LFSTTRQGRGVVATTTVLTAAALVATLTAGSSVADPGGPGTADSGRSTSALTAALPDGAAAGLRWVTLITGDRVGVDAKGRAVTVDRAEGRGEIPLRSWTEGGRTYVIPRDAERLVARGTLDLRLFDVTTLSSPESRRAYSKGLKVIVAYEGASAPAARKGVRADARVQRTLPSLGADAVTVPERDAGALWAAVTRAGGTGDARTARAVPGVARVWLDGVRSADLNTSVGQIGAPKAWQAGYDGKGVRIAVLDTGVDETHPDLKGKVAQARNFSDAPDTKDRSGHGTHVAGTAAGTGARSGGTYKGVAPGAEIISGKVLNDFGSGTDSTVIAGMEWAAAEGAHVINMSLGAADTPELDPVEALVNKLSKEKGVLFAISAGNSGPDAGSVGSPGSAESALTVGAVDDNEKMAPFSSVGPRTGDGAAKPDVTAPGVDITAASSPGSAIATEYGESPAGYVTISGTSMAAPHAAGAAALLKQANPSWSGERIKAVLTASAKDGGHSVFQQGTGRIAIDRALGQTVVADETSVSFGRQAWPHTDDKPVAKSITYRNLGDTPVTLNLAVKALDPKGKPAPAGFFTLGADRVTIPAGGTASVPFTADTRIGGTNDGAYSAVVTATGGGQTVRSTAAVDREVESYDLTINYRGRDGKPNKDFTSFILPLTGEGFRPIFESGGNGTAKLRLPKGDYLLESLRSVEGRTDLDRLVQPRLSLTRNTTFDADARLAKPISMSIPERGATLTEAATSYTVEFGERGLGSTFFLGTFDGFRTAQLGPKTPTGVKLSETFHAQWDRGSRNQYNGVSGGPVTRLSTGHTTKFKAGDFAKVSVTAAAAARNKKGITAAVSGLDGIGFTSPHRIALPGTRTHHVATIGKKNPWALGAMQFGAEDMDTNYLSPGRNFRPGTSSRVTLGAGVHSPLSNSESGIYRFENIIAPMIPLFSDGQGNAGWSTYSSAKTTLHRGKTLIGENRSAPEGMEGFKVDAANAEYTLATSVRRASSVSAVGTRIDASWTFRSAKPAGVDEVTLTELSAVRFGAQVAVDGTVEANRKVTFPVTVQGPAAGKGLKSLAVSVSYDGGKTWQKVAVSKGKVTVKNPAKGKSVALRASVADTKGGKASVTVYNAYIGK